MASLRQCFYCKQSFPSSQFHRHLKQCAARQSPQPQQQQPVEQPPPPQQPQNISSQLMVFAQVSLNDRNKSGNLLIKIFENILKEPNNRKYRDINCKTITSKFNKCTICVDLLLYAGFEKSKDGERLILNSDKPLNTLKFLHDRISQIISDDNNNETDNDVSEQLIKVLMNEGYTMKEAKKAIKMSINSDIDNNAIHTDTKSPHNDEKADNIEPQCQGPIITTTGISHGIKCWGKLIGSELSFYKNKYNMSDIPYDVINVSHFNKIQKRRNANPMRPFGIALFNEDKSEYVFYVFEREENRNNWYSALSEAITNKKGYNRTDIDVIDSVWSLIQNKNLLFVVLRKDNSLYFYKNKYDKKYFLNVNINECKKVKCIQNDTHSSFKYGLKLEQDTTAITLFFKQNNLRFEWHAHLEFIIDNYNKQHISVSYNADADDEIEIKNEDSSFDALLPVLSKYDEWIKHKKQTKLILNHSYLTILNHFHSILDGQTNVDFSKYRCNDDNNCQYILRQIERSRNNQRSIHNLNNNIDNILHQLLDRIHCYIAHQQAVVNNVKDKFVVNIQQTDENKDDNADNKQNDVEDVATFAFGENVTYYDTWKRFDNYVIPYFANLKEELTSNPYYKIDDEKYHNYYLKALKFKQSQFGKRIRAKKYGLENEPATIKVNDPITVNHIISLMTYCNETELQKIYKKHTRKLYQNESRKSVFNRNRFIANWNRYLTESCLFYGNEMESNDVVYCGMDRKLLFDSFVFTNHSPLSTSSSIMVAQNFSMNQGIILKLKRNGPSVNSRYFDMIPLSNFDEKERFFCSWAELRIVDILIDGEWNTDTISSLELLQKILNGSLFYYEWNEYLYSDKIQENLINLLNNYITHTKENEYFQQITSKIIKSFIDRDKDKDPMGNKMIFLNISEIKKLNESLSKFFVKPNALLFHDKVFQNENIKTYPFENYQKIHFNEQGTNTLKQMGYGFEGELKISDFEIIDHFFNYKHKFELFVQKTYHENQYYFVIKILLKPMMEHSMKIGWDIVVEDVQYEQTQIYGKLSREKYYTQSMILFPFSQISHLNELSININVRIIDVAFHTMLH